MAKKDELPIHEGPMADSRGTGWRADAARLEAADQRRLENPMQTLPNSMTTIDKAHAARAKSDEGSISASDVRATDDAGGGRGRVE